jgi:hypothetical protein
MFIFGIVYTLFALLLVTSIVITSVDKLLHSACGILHPAVNCGYILNNPTLFNPFDKMLSLLAPVRSVSISCLSAVLSLVGSCSTTGVPCRSNRAWSGHLLRVPGIDVGHHPSWHSHSVDPRMAPSHVFCLFAFIPSHLVSVTVLQDQSAPHTASGASAWLGSDDADHVGHERRGVNIGSAIRDIRLAAVSGTWSLEQSSGLERNSWYWSLVAQHIDAHGLLCGCGYDALHSMRCVILLPEFRLFAF